jgi:serine/threonine protein kinase
MLTSDQVIMSNAADSQQVLMSLSGWVKKKVAKTGLWHRRFMTITGTELSFFKDDTGKAIEQKISLSPHTTACLIEDPTARFQIHIPGEDPMVLVTETRSDAMRWITAIQTVCSPVAVSVVSMDQFRVLSVLGRGFYGKVLLCQKLDSQEIYAVKSIQKKRLQETGSSLSVIAERNILMKAHHPFIVNLCFAFQTSSKFYLGLEYAPGGELFYHMEQTGLIQIDDARLYVAEIGLALSYLHSIGVIYRDLKPENVLLDGAGHIKLTDFGLSKALTDSDTTTTFCGTSEYLAPEVVLQMPYSYAVDMWALGVLTYEMIMGSTPFYDENKSRMFTAIVSGQPNFPPQLDSRICDFISKLLTKNAAERPTFEAMKSHPFFEGFDWVTVYNRGYRANFIPPAKDPLTPTNFDPEFTSEVPVDSFVPPALDSANVPGFSYFDDNITKLI